MAKSRCCQRKRTTLVALRWQSVKAIVKGNRSKTIAHRMSAHICQGRCTGSEFSIDAHWSKKWRLVGTPAPPGFWGANYANVT